MQNHSPKDSAKIEAMAADASLRQAARETFLGSCRYNYSYNFTWLGRPIIQYPQDIMAMQEIIWQVKPELIIETGIAHGGSLIFSASMLALIGGSGAVLGIDIEIRSHNRAEIEKHPMGKCIRMIEGSSIDKKIVDQVHAAAAGKKPIMVFLDSNHTQDHVLQELSFYSALVTKGSYLVVLDTVIEDMPADSFPNRSWGKGNNPKTAVWEFLKSNPRFMIDREIQDKLLLTVAPDGYLKCIAD
jgi:cephalosporin hydroxylase